MDETLVTPAPVKKKRNRDTLSQTVHQKRCAATSRLNGDCYLGVALACDDSKEKFKAYSQRGKANMKAYWTALVNMESSEEGYEPDNDSVKENQGKADNEYKGTWEFLVWEYCMYIKMMRN
jgi:hypothetical protein